MSKNYWTWWKSHLDILLAISKETERVLRKHGYALPDVLLEDISTWFAEKIMEQQQVTDLKADLKTKAEAGGKIPFLAELLATFTAEIKTASSRRVSRRAKNWSRSCPVSSKN